MLYLKSRVLRTLVAHMRASRQAGREVRVMVVPEVISDSDMVLLARDISKQIENQMEYPGQIKVSIVRESRAVDYAK